MIKTRSGKIINKIWFDLLTPKDIPFFAPMIGKLGSSCKILLTSRKYGEVTSMARMQGVHPEIMGRHGGKDLVSKLKASTKRISLLTDRVLEFAPDLTISFCSPEAARVSFGVGIPHVAFYDTPHAIAILKLTMPLIQRLLIPYVSPKKNFAVHGIDPGRIIQYRAIDAAVTIKRNVDRSAPLPFQNARGHNILIRAEESHASYKVDTDILKPIAERVVSEFGDANNVVVLARYPDQARALSSRLGRNAKVVLMKYDGVHLLENTDVFVGSGGTMTAESALMGVPTISYGAITRIVEAHGTIPNIVEGFLERKRLLHVESEPDKVVARIIRLLESDREKIRARARSLVSKMSDPTDDLMRVIDGL